MQRWLHDLGITGRVRHHRILVPVRGAVEIDVAWPDLDGLRYASVFRYYGNAISDGVDAPAFAGVTLVAVALAAVGATLFGRRDLAA